MKENLCIVILGIALAFLTCVGCRRDGAGDALVRTCLNNLRIVVGAKEQFAVTNSCANGTPVVMQDLLEFVKMRNPVYFRCPRGQEFVIGPVGTKPRCPIHGSPDEISKKLR